MDPLIITGPPAVLVIVQTLHPVIPDRLRPLAALVCGWFVAAIYAASAQIAWIDTPLTGLMVGLAASGLHSGARSTTGAR